MFITSYSSSTGHQWTEFRHGYDFTDCFYSAGAAIHYILQTTSSALAFYRNVLLNVPFIVDMHFLKDKRQVLIDEKTHASWQESNFIRLSTHWRSFSFSLQVRQVRPWCDWSIPRFTGSRQWDGCDLTKRSHYGVHKFLSGLTLLALRFFYCSVRVKVSSDCLIVEVYLITGFPSFLTDVHFANAFICIILHEGQNVLN